MRTKDGCLPTQCCILPCAANQAASSSGGGEGSGSTADALFVVAREAVQAVIGAFGRSACGDFLAAGMGQPAIGTRADLQSLLDEESQRLQPSNAGD